MIVAPDIANTAVRLSEEVDAPVFPLRADKTPLTPNGFKDAVAGEDAIHDLFTRRPATLIGIATGGVSRLCVVDIDRKNGKNGFLWSGLQDLPETLSFSTPSGGQHRYFYLPEGVDMRCSANAVFDGIDIRADGGYVAQGESYRRIIDAPIATLAKAEIALLSPSKPITERIADLNAIAGTDAARRVREIAPGAWHDNVRDTVAHLVAKGVADDVIQSLMAGFTTAGFSAADTRREVQTMIDGARRKGWAPEAPESHYMPFMRASEVYAADPPEWLVEGLLPRVGVGIIAGASGSGKTYISIDLAMAVANGELFANNHATQRSRVLYGAGEDRAGVAKRVTALLQYRGTTDDDLILWQGIGLAHTHDIEHLQTTGEKFGLVIIDTLSKATPGIDENSNSEMAAAIERAYGLSSLWNCFVLIVAHTGKEASKGVRGASALVANVDTVLRVVRPNRGDKLTLTVDKMKQGPEDAVVDFRMKQVDVVNPRTGEIEGDLVVVPTVASAGDMCRRVLANEGDLSAKAVLQRVTRYSVDQCYSPVTEPAIKMALSRLVKSGAVINIGGKYSLAAGRGDE